MMRALMNVWEPREMSADFLTMQDTELQQQAEDKGVVTIVDRGLTIWKGDITRLKADAIVNAANAQGLGCWAPLHNCIYNCIHSAAGIQLRKECNDQLQGRLLKTGEAMMTSGYNLPAKHVIHTVGPIIETGMPTKEQEEQLAQCYRSSLDLVRAGRTGEHRFLLHINRCVPFPQRAGCRDCHRDGETLSETIGQDYRVQRILR